MNKLDTVESLVAVHEARATSDYIAFLLREIAVLKGADVPAAFGTKREPNETPDISSLVERLSADGETTLADIALLRAMPKVRAQALRQAISKLTTIFDEFDHGLDGPDGPLSRQWTISMPPAERPSPNPVPAPVVATTSPRKASAKKTTKQPAEKTR
jgi:hypothetical protein